MRISIEAAAHTNDHVTADHFGGNTIYYPNTVQGEGRPFGRYIEAIDELGITTVRFPAGQVEEFFANGIVIGGDMPTELRGFLTWARDGEHDHEVTLVLPADESYTNAEDIKALMEVVLGEFPDVVKAVEIGNEYWGPTDVPHADMTREEFYGQRASDIAEAVAEAELITGEHVDILVQTANAKGTSSSYAFQKPLSLGLTEEKRWELANEDIQSGLSDEAVEAIDGYVHHFYWSRYSEEDPGNNLGYRMDWHVASWSEFLGSDAELHVTEWNVSAKLPDIVGITSAGAMIAMFSDMIAVGAASAQVWPPQHNTRNDLAGGHKQSVIIDEASGLVVNSVNGAIFDLMSDSLIGKERLALRLDGADPERRVDTDVVVHAFADNEELVVYLASTSRDAMAIEFNVGDIMDGSYSVSGVRVGYDQSTSDGYLSNDAGAADTVMIDGMPYYLNEDDVRATVDLLTHGDLVRGPMVHVDLDPFEVVELTFSGSISAYDSPSELPGGRHLVGTADPETMVGRGYDDVLEGRGGADRLEGGAGDDTLEGGLGSDVLIGGEGDDTLWGGKQRDTLEGGNGADLFVFAGTDAGQMPDVISDFEIGIDLLDLREVGTRGLSEVTADYDAFHGAVVVGVSSPDGPDLRMVLEGHVDPAKILNPDNFVFDGEMPDLITEEDPPNEPVVIEPDDAASLPETSPSDAVPDAEAFDEVSGSIYRLYTGLLEREPDTEGLSSWSSRLSMGKMDLGEVADHIIRSPEFVAKFDEPTAQGLVNKLYDVVLDRTPDPDGFQHWVSKLEDDPETFGDVVIGFTESIEYRAITQQDAERFMFEQVATSHAGDVFSLFAVAFERDPTTEEFTDLTARLASGTSIEAIRGKIFASPEFTERQAELNDEEFVSSLFKSVLDREPQEAGLNSWTDLLAQDGMDRPTIALMFAESPESVICLSQDLAHWLQTGSSGLSEPVLMSKNYIHDFAGLHSIPTEKGQEISDYAEESEPAQHEGNPHASENWYTSELYSDNKENEVGNFGFVF